MNRRLRATPRRSLVAPAAIAALAALAPGCGGAGPAGVAAGAPAGATTGVAMGAGDAGLAAARAKADLARCPVPAAARAPRAELPDLSLPCLAGGPDVPLARLAGVPLVLNAWASWCGPCRAELPAFERVAEAARQGSVRVLGVDTEDAPASGLAFAAARGVHIPSVLDGSGALRTSRHIAGLPFTLFVRPDGSVASVHVGPLSY